MRLFLLILITSQAIAQHVPPATVYGMHTRLGMNGNIKTVTTYKYTRLKYNQQSPETTKGTLYSVIKNRYDTAGRIVQDSTAIYYNSESAHGYCKTYSYDSVNNTHVINIVTRFDCFPPFDNKASLSTIVELTTPDNSTVLAREYDGHELKKKRSKVLTSYRFTLKGGLIQRTVFDAYKKGVRYYGSSTYKYDRYKNFTETTLKVAETDKQVIKHKVLKIDDYGNALYMLNFINNNEEPEFMTKYEFEYY